MKKLIATCFIALSISNIAFADCDFSTGVTKQPDGNFLYTPACHIAVGEMKRDLNAAKTEIVEYAKVIDLKDLAISKADERADLWMNTGFKLQDRMNVIDDLKNKNQLLTFFAGVALTGIAVWGAVHLISK